MHTLMYKVLYEQPESSQNLDLERALKLQPLLDEALEIDPEQRYPSATHSAAALQSVDVSLPYEENEIIKNVDIGQAGELKFFHECSLQQLPEFVELAT